jgi:hypothetical protein
MKVVAIGTAIKPISDEQRAQIMPKEAPHTLQLHIDGVIEQMFFRQDRPGTVFLMNVDTVEKAKTITDSMELVKQGVVTYEFYPVGPMKPLGFLLQPFAQH